MSPSASSGDVGALPDLAAELPPLGGEDAEADMRNLLDELDRQLVAALAQGIPAAKLAMQRAACVDRMVVHVWTASVGEQQDVALLAVGGYGRGLLFPYSDVDLLVLAEGKLDSGFHAGIERFIATLWDIGLHPAHALRNLADCRRLAAEDVSVFTSLLEARLLSGEQRLGAALEQLVGGDDLWPKPAYLAAKRAERDKRHARFDDTAHNLEPDIKEGPGGLRTLDLLRWLGRRILGVDGLDGLVDAGLLDPAEREALAGAERTLQRYRYALHAEAGRAEERLLFDHQRALAGRLGFHDPENAAEPNDPKAREAPRLAARDGRLAFEGPAEPVLGVEQFMQGYYRAATLVERLGVQLVERFDELLEPDAEPQPIDAHYQRRGKRLETRDPDLFLRDPAALVEAFVIRLDHPGLTGFTAETMRRIQHALAHHGDRLADNPQVLAALRDLFQRGAPAVEALWRMNRHGVLAALLPSFARVVGRMQYDLFHVYTVDEHTLRVMRNVAFFAEPEARRQFPVACDIWESLDKPEMVLLAALFHDIAKGRGGDHSTLGEADARQFCQRLGLPEADTELVAWLVRWHLLMSTTAQRQDITDPAVVHRFATVVGDWERLDCLYLLTIADIRGTSPKLWNSWKDRLLADLYVAARYALRSDLALPLRAEQRVAACRDRAGRMLEADGLDPAVIERVWRDLPDASFLRHRPEQIAWQTRAMIEQGPPPLVAAHPMSVRGTTELFVCAEDRDGLFAAITATLDRLRFQVVEARILSSPGGLALDTFLLLDDDSHEPASPERAEELSAALRVVLERETWRSQPVRRGLSRRLRHFQMTPAIEYLDDPVSGRTQLALVCSDRPGLLAAVAQAFSEVGIRVHDARVATFGERVEDFFQLTGSNGQLLDQTTRTALSESLADHIDNSRGETFGASA